MKIKISEATPLQIDWAVAQCEGVEVEYLNDGITKCLLRSSPFTGRYAPSSEWAQGGPIIEREGISLFDPCSNDHDAWLGKCGGYRQCGTTPLIAAMRCYVASKLGDEVSIPEELK